MSGSNRLTGIINTGDGDWVINNPVYATDNNLTTYEFTNSLTPTETSLYWDMGEIYNISYLRVLARFMAYLGNDNVFIWKIYTSVNGTDYNLIIWGIGSGTVLIDQISYIKTPIRYIKISLDISISDATLKTINIFEVQAFEDFTSMVVTDDTATYETESWQVGLFGRKLFTSGQHILT